SLMALCYHCASQPGVLPPSCCRTQTSSDTFVAAKRMRRVRLLPRRLARQTSRPARRPHASFATRSALLTAGRERPCRPAPQNHKPVPGVQGRAALSRRQVVATWARLRSAAISVALTWRELEPTRRQVHAALGDRLKNITAHGVDFLGVLIDARDDLAVR